MKTHNDARVLSSFDRLEALIKRPAPRWPARHEFDSIEEWRREMRAIIRSEKQVSREIRMLLRGVNAAIASKGRATRLAAKRLVRDTLGARS